MAEEKHMGGMVTAQQPPRATPGEAPTHKFFAQRHPSYDAAYWERCRLLFVGGKELLCNDAVMAELLPKHPAEPALQYEIRRRMAYYENVAGSVINYICAGLSQDAVRVEAEGSAPAFYADFADDTGPARGRTCTLPELVKELVQGLLLYPRMWCRVDLPLSDPAQFVSEAEQEAAGALRAYAVAVSPQLVVDWEEDASGTGELAWALMREVIARRTTLFDSRALVTWRYTLFTPTAVQTFDFTFDSSKQPTPGENDAPTAISPPQPHTFGRVPLLRFEPPQQARALHAMAMLEPLARRHLEASNAKAFAEARVLFTPRTVFLARRPLEPDDEQENDTAGDANRALVQRHASSSIVQMDEKDRVEYPAPPTQVFDAAEKSCRALVEAMYRVTHQMALNLQATPSAVGRSGESKAEDRASTSVVLGAIGEVVRTWLESELYPLLAAGRGDGEIAWVAKGLEHFQPGGAADLVALGANLTLLTIESPTFQTAWKRRVATVVLEELGEEVTPELQKKIEAELSGSEAHAPTRADQAEAEAAALAAKVGPPDDDEPGE